MCVRDFQTLTLADLNFGPFADKWRKMFENIYPKMRENEFLAVYLCIIEKIS